ncbi:XRE family transcriptional regulator [Rhizobium hainanense]|uniref:Transcriptional regulator, XRE family with cupin sensor n=1 Tax=Rhizobium hainanense TaxID=52131 RepID=A0A1C3W8X3_9HYPH|nr:XRE family transcriptional regulator [Rhizobium hainanense]SCB36393.1 transcriptional regulator, XRE family with cupin sensor [Rhizobium hainanense]
MSNILHSQDRANVLAHVSGNLRRLRNAAGLSQIALAEASGISRRMIIAVEAGDANISLSSLDKLAAAMGVGFVDLVSDPDRTSSDINELTWRGKSSYSEGILLGTAPATREAQMWSWSLEGGDRYDAEPDPQGWHEMIFVTRGVLTLVLSGVEKDYPTGTFAIYSSAQAYSYSNRSSEIVQFIRNVIS